MEPLRYSVPQRDRQDGTAAVALVRTPARPLRIRCPAHAHATLTTPSAPFREARDVLLPPGTASHGGWSGVGTRSRAIRRRKSATDSLAFRRGHGQHDPRVHPRMTRATRILSVQPRMTRTPRILRVQLRTTRILSDWRRTNTRLCVGRELQTRHRLQPIGTRLLVLTLRREPRFSVDLTDREPIRAVCVIRG